MDRREMLRGLAAGTAAPLVASLFPAELMVWGREVHAAAMQGESIAPLPARIIETLTAACERIIPTDETPGAVAAGVPAFIDRMLAEAVRRARAGARRGWSRVARCAVARAQRAFVRRGPGCRAGSVVAGVGSRGAVALVRHGEVP